MTDKLLLSILEKVKNGIKVEGTNLELKRQWWDLKSDHDEFLKDICSMANTHTGDPSIIIGLDENGDLHDASLPNDEAKIQSKHKDKIEPKLQVRFNEVEVKGKTLSIITIPHSANRPHVIKKYKNRENWIPVRVGTSTLSASRSDLDEMYKERDRSNLSDLSVRLFDEKITWDNFAGYGKGGSCFAVRLTLDNYKGQAPDYITNVVLREHSGDHWESKHFLFESLRVVDGPLKVEAQDLKENVMVYISDQEPTGLRERRPMPDIDRDTLKLIIHTKSGRQIYIKIKPGWIHEG